ncbi:unnamed protein product [Rotaria socialis]|uniref:VCBS repeat-containing protein n=1 Tax=Rotaria socialis TaxID=392032 RepID=A0A821PH50_9BILA|nr:unnamed protein product [Rotaria socialis]
MTDNWTLPWSSIIVTPLEYSFGIGITFGDLHNDNREDPVVVNRHSDSVGILIGLGNRISASVTQYKTGSYSTPFSVAVGDFNNDNRSGIVITNSNEHNITYSTGTDSGPHCVAVGDFNNDSRVDIAVVNHYNNFIGIFEEFGYGTFGNEMIYPTESGSLSRSLVVADFNDDKLLDLAVANSGASSAGVFFGYCCDPFRNQSTYDTGNNSHPSSVAVGDPNNDNQSDIVVANYGTNNIVDLGEFNGDRWLDIAVAIHGTNYTAVLLESGDGSFAKQTFHWIGNIALTPAAVVGDFNSDKQLNIILSNDASNNIGILYGYGNGTFETLNLCSIGYNSRPYSLGMSDLNSDTQLDIVIENRLKNNI